MSGDFDLDNTGKYFIKGSASGLVLCSLILFFIHYNFSDYFGFQVPLLATFIFWAYLIGNSVALYFYLQKSIFECPKCKKRYKR